MAKFVGRLLQLGIAKEGTRGAGAASTYMLPNTSFSFDDKIVQARSVGALGKLADSEEAFVTTKYGQGDFEGEIRSKSFGLLLYSMLGTVSSAAVVDESYTHTFTINQSNQHQSLSFVVVDSNTSELYKLVMLESLELTAELDEVVRYSASFMGKQAVGTSETVPAAVAENKFTKKHLSFKIAENIAGLAGATASSIKSLNLTINKNVALDDVLGTAEPEDILNRQLGVEGSVTLNYEAETFKNYMKDNTDRAIEIKLTNTDDKLGSGLTNPSLTIQMPKVDFFEWEPDYSLDEIVSQTISFKASRDVSGGADMISTCSLVNDVVSY